MSVNKIHVEIEPLLRTSLEGQSDFRLLPDGKLLLRGKPDTTLRVEHYRGLSGAVQRASGTKRLYVIRRSTAAQRDKLRKMGASFVDPSRGIVRIQVPGLLIDRTDLPRFRYVRSLPGRNPFGDRASLVPRTLLQDWRREWLLEEMRDHTGLSHSMVSRVVEALRSEQLVEAPDIHSRPLRFRIGNPWPLFLAWASYYSWRDNEQIRVAAPIGDPSLALPTLTAKLRSTVAKDLKWAFGLHAAASQRSRHATWDVVHVYVAAPDIGALTNLALELEWPPSEHGKLVFLRPKYRRSLWQDCEEAEGLTITGTVQTMLDLWDYPVRGREQAEHLARVLDWPAVPAT